MDQAAKARHTSAIEAIVEQICREVAKQADDNMNADRITFLMRVRFEWGPDRDALIEKHQRGIAVVDRNTQEDFLDDLVDAGKGRDRRPRTAEVRRAYMEALVQARVEYAARHITNPGDASVGSSSITITSSKVDAMTVHPSSTPNPALKRKTPGGGPDGDDLYLL